MGYTIKIILLMPMLSEIVMADLQLQIDQLWGHFVSFS
jgi:hypothetical protein